MPDETPAPDKVAHRGNKPRVLTDEQEVQLLDAYTATDEPVVEISKRFEIRETYVYNVLDRAGVSWRRGNPETYMQWQAAQARPAEETVPPETVAALENMLRLPVLPARPEPVAPTPSVERRARPSFGHHRWVIRVEGELQSDLDDIADVIAEIKQAHPFLRIVAINPA